MEGGEDTASAPSTPVTPGTPAAPLFGAFRNANGRRSSSSLLRSFKCFNSEAWSLEEGGMPQATCALPPISLARKVGAEFIGTLILMFAAIATPVVNQKTQGVETLIGLAASSGLAVMVVIISTGHISGAHLNPAITIAFAALRHFPWKHVPVYIGAQVVASICASLMVKVIFEPAMGGGVTVPRVGYAEAFALELIITFNLMFVVTAVATDTKAVGELAGIAVGATVMLNILIAGESTGASMNPVRSLGPAIATNNYRGIWLYITAPVVGALAGAGIYSAVKLPEEADQKPVGEHSFRR